MRRKRLFSWFPIPDRPVLIFRGSILNALCLQVSREDVPPSPEPKGSFLEANVSNFLCLCSDAGRELDGPSSCQKPLAEKYLRPYPLYCCAWQGNVLDGVIEVEKWREVLAAMRVSLLMHDPHTSLSSDEVHSAIRPAKGGMLLQC